MDPSTLRNLTLRLDQDVPHLEKVFKALGSTPRLRILRLLSERLLNVSEVARELSLPVSTANSHIALLEEAGLLLTERRPATRGSQKVCTVAVDNILVQLPREHVQRVNTVEYAMPIGGYVDCEVAPPCGLASEADIIGLLDDSHSFYEPDRLGAQLLWFHQGYVEYRFPKRLPPTAILEGLYLSFEACSEAPLHHDDWPSDITVWINDLEIGTWTSPSDFGGERGKLTPEWWDLHNTQYGLLKVWQVGHDGSKVDGMHTTNVTLDDLDLGGSGYITVRIGVEKNARHVGGLNLFGRAFGNYPQGLVLRLLHR